MVFLRLPLLLVPTAPLQRDRFQHDIGIVRKTQVNIENQLEVLAQHHKEHSTHMKKVEAEADSLAARLKVEFGRGEGGGLPSEGDLKGQSADDHLYKVCIWDNA